MLISRTTQIELQEKEEMKLSHGVHTSKLVAEMSCVVNQRQRTSRTGTSGVNILCNYIMQTVTLLLFSLWFYG